MQDDQPVVTRRNDILLEIVRAHRVTEGLGRQRVFRQVAGRASVSNDDGTHIRFYVIKIL